MTQKWTHMFLQEGLQQTQQRGNRMRLGIFVAIAACQLSLCLAASLLQEFRPHHGHQLKRTSFITPMRGNVVVTCQSKNKNTSPKNLGKWLHTSRLQWSWYHASRIDTSGQKATFLVFSWDWCRGEPQAIVQTHAFAKNWHSQEQCARAWPTAHAVIIEIECKFLYNFFYTDYSLCKCKNKTLHF